MLLKNTPSRFFAASKGTKQLVLNSMCGTKCHTVRRQNFVTWVKLKFGTRAESWLSSIFSYICEKYLLSCGGVMIFNRWNDDHFVDLILGQDPSLWSLRHHPNRLFNRFSFASYPTGWILWAGIQRYTYTHTYMHVCMKNVERTKEKKSYCLKSFDVGIK